MAEFRRAVEAVLANEGGYVCHPDDPGGETNFGISKRRYPDLDIKSLGRVEAMAIYRRDYWNPLYDKIGDQAIADKVFDASINLAHGDTRPYYATPTIAVELLQRALDDEGYTVAIDGRFGPQTLMAVRLIAPTQLLRAYRARLALHYSALVAADPVRQVFALGWLRRAVAALALATLPMFTAAITLPQSAGAQFDTLERMEADFFKLNEQCAALPADELTVGGQEYRRRLWQCGHRVWRLWQYRCPEGYWSRAFVLDQADPYEDSYYLDRFASLHNGKPGVLIEAYRPPCGG